MSDNDKTTQQESTTSPAPRRIAAGVTGKQSAKGKTPWTQADRAAFLEKAPATLVVKVDGLEMLATKQEFSTGSVGYYLTGKHNVMVDGKLIPLQLGFNLTAIGSKPEKG